MEYNVLADCYTDDKHGFFLNKDHIDFEQRYSIICKEIEQSKPDLICLCEVDHLDTHYGKFLTELGYQYHGVSRKGLDYVLIAFKPEVFELLEKNEVQHSELGEKFGR